MQISPTNRIKFSVENIGLQINTDKTETEFANSNHQNQTLRFIRKDQYAKFTKSLGKYHSNELFAKPSRHP